MDSEFRRLEASCGCHFDVPINPEVGYEHPRCEHGNVLRVTKVSPNPEEYSFEVSFTEYSS